MPSSCVGSWGRRQSRAGTPSRAPVARRTLAPMDRSDWWTTLEPASAAALADTWIPVGPARVLGRGEGTRRAELLDGRFGADGWRIAHVVRGRIVPFDGGDPRVRGGLPAVPARPAGPGPVPRRGVRQRVRRGVENVHDPDYDQPHTAMNHYQDISVRRVVAELVDDPDWPWVTATADGRCRPGRPRHGRSPTGCRGRAGSAATGLLQIREPDSPGYVLSPAVVPAHDPALVTAVPGRIEWYHAEGCGHLSVEAFWQASKVIEVRYDRFLALGDGRTAPAGRAVTGERAVAPPRRRRRLDIYLGRDLVLPGGGALNMAWHLRDEPDPFVLLTRVGDDRPGGVPGVPRPARDRPPGGVARRGRAVVLDRHRDPARPPAVDGQLRRGRLGRLPDDARRAGAGARGARASTSCWSRARSGSWRRLACRRCPRRPGGHARTSSGSATTRSSGSRGRWPTVDIGFVGWPGDRRRPESWRDPRRRAPTRAGWSWSPSGAREVRVFDGRPGRRGRRGRCRWCRCRSPGRPSAAATRSSPGSWRRGAGPATCAPRSRRATGLGAAATAWRRPLPDEAYGPEAVAALAAADAAATDAAAMAGPDPRRPRAALEAADSDDARSRCGLPSHDSTARKRRTDDEPGRVDAWEAAARPLACRGRGFGTVTAPRQQAPEPGEHRPGATRLACPGYRTTNPSTTSTTPAITIAAADLGLAAEHVHRDRGPGLRVGPRAAPPRLVAGDVRVLLLERHVALVRAARAQRTDDDQRDAGHDQRQVQQSHAQASASSRSRTSVVTRAASAAPPVAFITWPTKNPATGLPAR